MDLLLFTIIFLAFFLAGETLASLWKPVYSHFLERLAFHTLLGLVAVALLTTALAFAGGIYPATGWIIVGVIFLGSTKTGVSFLKEVSTFQPGLGKNFHQRSAGPGIPRIQHFDPRCTGGSGIDTSVGSSGESRRLSLPSGYPKGLS